MTTPVTLWGGAGWWCEREPSPHGEGYHKYRALPAAEFDAIVSRDAERKGVIDDALCQKITTLTTALAAARADRDALAALLKECASLVKPERFRTRGCNCETIAEDLRDEILSRIETALKETT